MPGKGGGGDGYLFIANFPYNVDWKQLEDHCRAHKVEIRNVEFLDDLKTGKPAGRALVKLEDHTEVETAIRSLNDKTLDGRPLLVREDRGRWPRRGEDGGKGFGAKGGRKGSEPRYNGDGADDRRGREGGRYVQSSREKDWEDGGWQPAEWNDRGWEGQAQGDRRDDRGAARSRSRSNGLLDGGGGGRSGGGKGGARLTKRGTSRLPPPPQAFRDVLPPPPPLKAWATSPWQPSRPLPGLPAQGPAKWADPELERLYRRRLFASNLAPGTRWKALKDVFRGVYKVSHADVVELVKVTGREACGIVER